MAWEGHAARLANAEEEGGNDDANANANAQMGEEKEGGHVEGSLAAVVAEICAAEGIDPAAWVSPCVRCLCVCVCVVGFGLGIGIGRGVWWCGVACRHLSVWCVCVCVLK
jgi:hypothetical protein